MSDSAPSAARETLIVAGLSVRALCEGAIQAGYAVHSIDCFADQDVADRACSQHKIGWSSHGVDSKALHEALDLCDPHARLAVLTASGFDQQPQVLTQIAQTRECLSVPASVFSRVYDPIVFFSLLQRLQIQHPATIPQTTDAVSTLSQIRSNGSDAPRWLSKEAGGSGGLHIRWLSAGLELDGIHYAQEFVEGLSVSVTALATPTQIHIIGLADQSPCVHQPLLPFTFSQAVSLADVSIVASVRQTIKDVVEKLYQALSLRGLVSFDFLVNDCQTWLLEVNPRPSANFALHDHNGTLLHHHIESLRHSDATDPSFVSARQQTGFRIIYASDTIHITDVGTWPRWVSDRPAVGSVIHKNQPVCTVHAQAPDSIQVVELLSQRADKMVSHICSATTHTSLD